MLVGVRPVVPPSPDDGGSLTWSCTNTPYLQISIIILLLLFSAWCDGRPASPDHMIERREE